MENNKFLEILNTRALQVEDRLLTQDSSCQSIKLLVSGGSSSTLMLLVFAHLQKNNLLKLPIEIVYLQFDNYVWLEREALRTLAKKLQIPITLNQISEVPLTSDKIWKSADKACRYDLIWKFINENIKNKMITGCGWTQYLRTSYDLSLAGKEVVLHKNFSANTIDFYTPEIWNSYKNLSQVHLFFELWSEIPFHSMRYWQDYVFQNIFSEFKPCLDWNLENYL